MSLPDGQPQRILIVRPSALGDVCRTVPLLASLKRACPDALIDWVVQDSFLAAVEHHPDLHEPIAFPRQRFGQWWRSMTIAKAMGGWFDGLRRRGYDVVIDAQGLMRSGLITAATRAPIRIGRAGAREIAGVGYNRRIDVSDHVHTVDQMLALLTAIDTPVVTDMRLYTASDAAAWWADTRAEQNIGERYAVLAPTARWATKRWPIDRWSTVASALRERGFASIIVIGGPDEQDQTTPLTRDADVVDLVGRTSIAQTMAVVAASDLVIANDSAPLHMAVGFGRPCIGLFGPTDPTAVGPYGRDDAVVRATLEPDEQPHYRDEKLGDSIMRRIPVGAVLDRVDAVIR